MADKDGEAKIPMFADRVNVFLKDREFYGDGMPVKRVFLDRSGKEIPEEEQKVEEPKKP